MPVKEALACPADFAGVMVEGEDGAKVEALAAMLAEQVRLAAA